MNNVLMPMGLWAVRCWIQAYFLFLLEPQQSSTNYWVSTTMPFMSYGAEHAIARSPLFLLSMLLHTLIAWRLVSVLSPLPAVVLVGLLLMSTLLVPQGLRGRQANATSSSTWRWTTTRTTCAGLGGLTPILRTAGATRFSTRSSRRVRPQPCRSEWRPTIGAAPITSACNRWATIPSVSSA